VAAFAVISWTEPFTLILYFIPVTMTGRTLFWVSVGLAVVGILNVNSHIANAAHLGGVLAGFIYARQVLHGRWPQWQLFARRERPRQAVVTRSRENKFWRANPIENDEVSTDSFLQQEVDPILEKISAQGIQSLTTRERDILEAARKKMK
jgi:hypothetical protein